MTDANAKFPALRQDTHDTSALRRFLPDSPPPRFPVWLTVTTALIALFWIWLQMRICSTPSLSLDGWTYVQAMDSLTLLTPDEVRTPMLPLMLKICISILGWSWGLIAVMFINWGCYLLSLKAIWQIGWYLRLRPALTALVVLTLVIFPGFWVFNNMIMTECLSICSAILLLWLAARYLLSPSTVNVLISGGVLIFMVFLKPQLVFFLPLMCAFWLIAGWKRPRQLIAPAIVLILNIFLIHLYTAEMHRIYGVSSLTHASTDNLYCLLRTDGLIIPEEIPDAHLRTQFQANYDSVPSGWDVKQRLKFSDEVATYTWADQQFLVDNALKRHPAAALRGAAVRLGRSMTSLLFYRTADLAIFWPERDALYSAWSGLDTSIGVSFIYPLQNLNIIPIYVGVAIWALFTVVWISIAVRRRSFPLWQALLSATFLTCLLTAVVGAMDNWGRLLAPALWLLPLMLASVAARMAHWLRGLPARMAQWLRGLPARRKVKKH